MNKLYLLLLILPFSTYAEEIKLSGLKEITMSLSCPCTFNESIKGATEGSYGSGALIFLIAPNEKPEYSIINLGDKNIKLYPTSTTSYACKDGYIYSSTWGEEDIELSATLEVTGPGAEACWFNGNISVKIKDNITSVPVKGACGC